MSKVALTSTHDILSEMLKRRNELPHFWFHESLFKPFDSLLSFEVYDDDIQDQVCLFIISYWVSQKKFPSFQSE